MCNLVFLSLALIFLLAFHAFSMPQTRTLIIARTKGLLEVQDSTDNIGLTVLLVGLEEGRLAVNLARLVREMGRKDVLIGNRVYGYGIWG